ncbi:TadG [Vibrio albus]|uniref:TadG n=1 Tax=Vibrio albus TaxID=2200953 RepID=A0A2U3BEK5_9VIBR|nr:TadE/TadG family type IV pilus assembly protein [Vibrio albus]PWI35215.1 TadG [Vibrio albus]
MVNLFKRQHGHAAILFVMMIPVLFGVFVLGTDGARAMQDRARLDDALEAASLAIAAHNDENKEPDDSSASGGDNEESIVGTGSNVNKRIAKAYIGQYMTDMDDIAEINIERMECNTSSGPACSYDGDSSDPLFFQYTVDAKTKHSSWFSGDVSLGDSFNVASQSTARKYQNETVDVVFVADFSGSMRISWTINTKDKPCSYYSDFDSYFDDGECKAKKYKGVLGVIKSVLGTLDKYNNKLSSNTNNRNTASFVPYNNFMQKEYDVDCDYLRYKYEIRKEKYCRRHYCSETSIEYTSVDYPETISGLWDYTGECYNEREDFHMVIPEEESTDSLITSVWNNISDFYPGGYTASFQGVIKAAQVIKAKPNDKKLIIVLSDGDDFGPIYGGDDGESEKIAETLYSSPYNMCDKIIDGLEATDEIEAKIAVIGFGYDYDINDNVGLTLCAGAENVYQAGSFEEIRTRILQLIVEEIGHLK